MAQSGTLDQRNIPVHPMKIPLYGVTLIVDHEDDRGSLVLQHSGHLLYRQLAQKTSVVMLEVIKQGLQTTIPYKENNTAQFPVTCRDGSTEGAA